MHEVEFQTLSPIKLPLIKAFYKQYYPSAKPKKNETIIVGYQQTNIIAVVRFRPVEQYQLLTGMLVHPDLRKQNIGSTLLQYCQINTLDSNTYCFAYSHLETFYQQAGFSTIDINTLPNSLQLLFKRYIQSGKSLMPMHYGRKIT